MKFLKRAGFVVGLAFLGAAMAMIGSSHGDGVLPGLLGGALLGLTLPDVIKDIIHKP